MLTEKPEIILGKKIYFLKMRDIYYWWRLNDVRICYQDNESVTYIQMDLAHHQK